MGMFSPIFLLFLLLHPCYLLLLMIFYSLLLNSNQLAR